MQANAFLGSHGHAQMTTLGSFQAPTLAYCPIPPSVPQLLNLNPAATAHHFTPIGSVAPAALNYTPVPAGFATMNLANNTASLTAAHAQVHANAFLGSRQLQNQCIGAEFAKICESKAGELSAAKGVAGTAAQATVEARFPPLPAFNTGPNQISLYGRAHPTNGNFMIVSQITRGGMQMQRLEQPNIRKAFEGKLQMTPAAKNYFAQKQAALNLEVSKAIAAVEEKAMAEASELAIARVNAQFLQSNITVSPDAVSAQVALKVGMEDQGVVVRDNATLGVDGVQIEGALGVTSTGKESAVGVGIKNFEAIAFSETTQNVGTKTASAVSPSVESTVLIPGITGPTLQVTNSISATNEDVKTRTELVRNKNS